MNLRLNFAPSVENAPKFAAEIVASVKEIVGIDLDYSVASLESVDRILEGFRKEGTTSEQVAETLFGFGCYVGEVFVRQAKGMWKPAADTKAAAAFGFPLVIQTGAAKFCNPIGKVFKRVDNGVEDSVPFFYHVFTKPSTNA